VLLKARLSRQKMSLPYGMAREPNYNILSEWIAYYLRYATRKKGVVLRISLLQLVTSKSKPLMFPRFNRHNNCLAIPTVRQSISNMYPATTKCDFAAGCHLSTFTEFCRDFPPCFYHIVDAGIDSHVPSLSLWPIECMTSLPIH
jgi:hypothetical protein